MGGCLGGVDTDKICRSRQKWSRLRSVINVIMKVTIQLPLKLTSTRSHYLLTRPEATNDGGFYCLEPITYRRSPLESVILSNDLQPEAARCRSEKCLVVCQGAKKSKVSKWFY